MVRFSNHQASFFQSPVIVFPISRVRFSSHQWTVFQSTELGFPVTSECFYNPQTVFVFSIALRSVITFMISVTVALLNGQAVLTDVDFNAFTTIGSLQNVVANNLGCLRDDVVLVRGHTTPSRVSTLSQIGLSGCVSLVAAILRCTLHMQKLCIRIRVCSAQGSFVFQSPVCVFSNPEDSFFPVTSSRCSQSTVILFVRRIRSSSHQYAFFQFRGFVFVMHRVLFFPITIHCWSFVLFWCLLWQRMMTIICSCAG